jgi:hypothetical protein
MAELFPTIEGDKLDLFPEEAAPELFPPPGKVPESSFAAETIKGIARGLRFIPDVIGAILGEDDIEMQEGPSLRGFLKESERIIAPKGTLAKQITGEIAAGTARQASLIALAKGKKAVVLPAMALGSGALKTRELLDEGVDTGTALGIGAANAALEAVTEAVPLGILLKKDMGLAKRVIGEVVSDVIGENIAEFGQRGIESAVLDKPFPTVEEAKNIALYTSLVATGQSAIMGTGAGLYHRLTKPAPKETLESPQEAELAVQVDDKTPSPTTNPTHLEGLDIMQPQKEIPRENINFRRIKDLGFTQDINEAGYLTPEGGLIDLSGKKEGQAEGKRNLPHHEITAPETEAQRLEAEDFNFTRSLLGQEEFIAMGNIRIDMVDRTLDILVAPTERQYAIIGRMVKELDGAIFVDLDFGLGEKETKGLGSRYLRTEDSKSTKYQIGTRPHKVISDIRSFYAPKLFENERAPMEMSESAKIERSEREVVTQPTTKKEAIKEYEDLVAQNVIKERSDEDIGKIIPKVMFPHTLAKKEPKFAPIFERGLQFTRDVDNSISEAAQTLEPYLELSDKSKQKVDDVILEEMIERNHPPFTVQELQARLTPEEVVARQSYRLTMRNAANQIGEHLIKMGNEPERVNTFINNLSPETYAPLRREGDFFVAVQNKAGDLIHYQHAKNKSQMKQIAIKFKGNKIFTGKVKKTSDEVLNEIPVNILAAIAQFDKGKDALEKEGIGIELPKVFSEILSQGFPQHLIQKKNVPGFEKSLGKPTADYILGLSKWMARREARRDMARDLARIDPKVESNLFGESKRYIDYVTGSTNELSKFRQWMFRYYLGGNLKSAMLNATQSFTTTFPTLSKYANFAGARLAEAGTLAVKPLSSIRKTDANLADALQQAIFDGVLSEQFVTMLRGEAYKNLDMTRLDSVLSFFFNHVEVFNRKTAFIAYYKAATGKGVRLTKGAEKTKLTHEEAIRLGEKFVDETQFIYSKADRPPVTRGVMAPAFTFRIFVGNYLSMLKNFISDREFSALARSLGVLTALGGVRAIPFFKDLEKVLERFGFDPRKSIRDFAGKWGDFVLHGAAFPLGLDISGALSTVELVPNDVQQGMWPSIADIVIGVPTDLLKRVNRSMYFANELGDPYRAVESLMPEAVRNPMVALRWYREGAARNAKGEPIAYPTIKDTVLKALAIQPALLTRAYEREHSEQLLSERARDASRNVNLKIAQAWFNKDQQGLADLMLEISRHNEEVLAAGRVEEVIIPNKRAIADAYMNMVRPEAVEFKRLPKKARQEFLRIQETFREGE